PARRDVGSAPLPGVRPIAARGGGAMRRRCRLPPMLEPAPDVGCVVRNNSAVAGFHPRSNADRETYREGTAIPTMQAVDSLPPITRALVNDHGYIDVFRAWRRRCPPERIRA